MNDIRPTGITVIGWIWAILGGLGLLGVLINILLFGFMPADMGSFMFSSSANGANMQGMYNFFQVFVFLFRHLWLILAFQLVIKGLSLIGGIGLLKLKEWGRKILEGLSWLYLVYMVAGSIFWVYFTSYLRTVLNHNMPDSNFGSGFTWILTALGLSIMLAICVGIVLMIRYLRSKTVYNAISGASGQYDYDEEPK